VPADPVVILTREPADNAPLRQLLEAAGVRVVEYPCLNIEKIPPPQWEWPAGLAPAGIRALAFTSRHAVAAFAPAWPEWPNREVFLAAVGDSTCRAMGDRLERGADVVADPPTAARLAMELADFLEIVLPDLPPWEHQVLWVRGDRSLDAFREAVLERDLELFELVVYRHREVDLPPVKTSPPAVPVFASPSAADNFFRANGTAWLGVTCVAVGPTTADRLAAHGCVRVVQAPAPGPEALACSILNTLEELKST